MKQFQRLTIFEETRGREKVELPREYNLLPKYFILLDTGKLITEHKYSLFMPLILELLTIQSAHAKRAL